MKQLFQQITSMRMPIYLACVIAGQISPIFSSAQAQDQILHQRSAQNFGYWTTTVVLYKQFFEQELPKVDRTIGENMHRIAFSRYVHHNGIYDWKKLTEADFRSLATTYNGISEFEMICRLKDCAGLKEAAANVSEADIKNARAALDYLKPEGYNSWVEFGKMLHRVEKETVSERAALNERHKQQSRGLKG